MVLLLLIYCLLLLPLLAEVLRWSLFCYSVLGVVWFCNHLDGEERAGCFALTVILMFCDSQCSAALPHGAVG